MTRNAGSEAWMSSATPTLAATVQTAWPVATPAAVATPARRPPARALRTVRAVSGPGVQMTTAETPRKASSWPSTRPALAGDGRDRPGQLVEVGQVVPGDLGQGQGEALLALLAMDAEALAVGVADALEHGQVGRPQPLEGVQQPLRPGPGQQRPGLLVVARSEEHTSELQSHSDLVCRLLLEKK